MPESPPDPHRPRAPYMRVLDALTVDIEAGRIQPGERIPSESELCERHGVARETARRAVRVLRERGLVETEWGRGTFVRDPSADQGRESGI
ncbi:winged helix-turn-helix domain-containing protein [Streptomyces sp. NPDC094034]|uniref:winged helix-turn-helix domain-containing protein n=1 Tax=Streptomyces sp. NPDC094034 TaxID=3155309 RepID=UPI003317CCFA